MCDLKTKTKAQLVAAYIKLREGKAAEKAKAEARLAEFTQAMEQIEYEMLGRLEKEGEQSSKTEFGTAYRTERVSVTAPDREAFKNFVKENDAWEFLDVRPNKTAVKEYAEIHGDLPPGISMRSIVGVNFNRA